MVRFSGRAWPALLLTLASTGCSKSSSNAADAGPAPVGPLDCATDAGDWPMYGQNVCNTRSAPGGGPITPQTASKLAMKWVYDAAGDVSATPAVVGGQVYVPDWGGMLTRIDGATGKAVWSRAVADILGISADAGLSGIAPGTDGGAVDTSMIAVYEAPQSRVTPIVTSGTVIFGMGSPGSQATMAAVDQDTGALRWKTPLDSHVTALITGSPALDNGIVYVGVSSGEEIAANVAGYPCCTFRGSAVALDAATGKIKWQTYMIDNVSHDAGWSGAAIWSGTPTIDRKRRLVYVTTGNNYSAAAGVKDLPEGNHIESIVALDMDTGAIKWSHRMTSGDVWTFKALLGAPDYDFGCAANLFQATIGGVTHDVVGAGQKSGVYWALDPDDGTLLWKTQVGPGGHLGGIHWGPAVDGDHVYVGVNNFIGAPYKMGGPDGGTTSVGSWAGLDPLTGSTLWQVANPSMTAPLNFASVNGPLAVADGVVFAGSMDEMGTMYALDGKTGAVLWQFQSGATVYGGPAIASGVVYWGTGYPKSRLGFGSPGSKLYAFEIPK